ncbi:endolytic transglycosylase MltG [Xiamenia xianingshaonis]|uniref:Endolytic murein transglycosylase n=1 Tax=Xiamenia xianingshaonis TaxID=2682776 RepID=A0A9E6MQ34_9ACTN|nr:endolytic transglycosylase MltG [Xiamenia xianingshaonis]NHM14064.1 endolytic transglycosylase MltG [Xiamenia xianingshaonis]QTU83930.1 endolytic transglycosylase MltG [Xiamenia xianingshaonis]
MTPRKNVTYSQRPTRQARAAHAKGDREFRTYDTSLIRPKRSKAPVVIAAVLAVVCLVVIGWGASVIFKGWAPESVATIGAGEEATVTIPEGTDASGIADILLSARVISNAGDFTNRVNELGVADRLKPGTYSIQGGTSVDQIIATLETGPGMGNALTIPEGSTIASIAEAVAEFTEGRITAEDFTKAASNASVYAGDYAFLKDVGENSLEGFLFPKTYEVTADATADTVIRQMLDQFGVEVANLDLSYPESQGYTFYDVVKLASIVEKEANGDEAVRKQVSAVFWNRLTDPEWGRLESDATTAYEVGHDPTAEEVHAETPYSTYVNDGLPPTPICNPSLSCMEAVCHPDEAALGTYYFFYFESDGQGDWNYSFSETYDEHMANFSDGEGGEAPAEEGEQAA